VIDPQWKVLVASFSDLTIIPDEEFLPLGFLQQSADLTSGSPLALKFLSEN